MQQNNRIITTLSSDIYLNLHVCNFNCLIYVTLYFSTCGHLENFHDTKQLIISLKELCACYFFAVVMDHDFENWPLIIDGIYRFDSLRIILFSLKGKCRKEMQGETKGTEGTSRGRMTKEQGTSLGVSIYL